MSAASRHQLVLVGAVVTALVATFGVHRVIVALQHDARPATRPVVVAAVDVLDGARLAPSDLRVVQWPAEAVPDGVTGVADSLVGRVTRMPVLAGEALVPARLAPIGAEPGLEAKISRGKRAMAVRIDDVTGVNGLLRPDSRVDVLVTVRPVMAGTGVPPVSRLFLANMRVLAIGTDVHRAADSSAQASGVQAALAGASATVTLEVTPTEAERLAVAMQEGEIQLVMRGYGDRAAVQTTGADGGVVMAAFGRTSAPTPAAPAVRPDDAATTSAPAPSRRAPVPPTLAQAPPSTPEPATPSPRADTITVQVMRGGQLTLQRFAEPAPARGTATISARP